jgi:hypothetical protein
MFNASISPFPKYGTVCTLTTMVQVNLQHTKVDSAVLAGHFCLLIYGVIIGRMPVQTFSRPCGHGCDLRRDLTTRRHIMAGLLDAIMRLWDVQTGSSA